MIFHVVGSDNDEPMRAFLGSWRIDLRRRFQTIHTHQLAGLRSARSGTYLFTDLERQTRTQLELQGQLFGQLAAHPEHFRVLNSPEETLARFELLRRLSEDGTNGYRAWRSTAIPSDLRFPVFVRNEADHHGSLTPLLEGWPNLEQEMVRVALSGVPASQTLVVEFCETGDADGLYRKYSAFKFGDRIVPRHLIFGRNWVLKVPDLIDEAKVVEEWDYLRSNPHEAELRRIFDMANIDYGRIDYGLLDGRIQVWEINTNPVVMLPAHQYQAAHIPAQEWFAPLAAEAFIALDDVCGFAEIPIRLRWPNAPAATATLASG